MVAACAPTVQQLGAGAGVPALTDQPGGEAALLSIDGARLPLRAWPAETAPEAVIIALHGFNDYGNAFSLPAEWWATQGVTTYAYDQRGFGAALRPGVWASERALIADLHAAVRAVRARHPDAPLYLLGESMGGAVILSAVAELDGQIDIDGLVLVAPAVWGWSTLNPVYKAALWLSAHTLPWKTVTGEDIDVTPSDNRDMLLALGRDPLVIKATRIDAIYGLVNLMERASGSAPAVRTPMLLLYGEWDDIIPPHAFDKMLGALNGNQRVVRYRSGFHMLLRDLQAETVWRDVLAWIRDPIGSLPSGEEEVATP
jgi:alpha-beta hydrolase superfamily lysophospholipase